MDKDFSCSIGGGYEFRSGNWHITPLISFQYYNRKWTASDGYLQYPLTGLWTGDEPKQNINGPVISYEQAIWFPSGSVELGYRYSFARQGRLQLAVYGSLYPYIWAETNDSHFLRSMQFYDTLSGGLGWNAALIIGIYPESTNGLGFIVRSGHERVTNVKGNTASNSTGLLSGPLAITEGYGSEMYSEQWYCSFSINIPVFTSHP